MGLISFMSRAGETLSGAFYELLHTGEDPAKLHTLPPERLEQLLALRIDSSIKEIDETLKVDVKVTGECATLTGEVPNQEICEKATLIAGNQQGIAMVDCKLTVLEPQAHSTFHTVENHETLEAISERYYGSTERANAILTANHPMLKHRDNLHAGQVIRVPIQNK